jgi:hypothetical protein
MTILKIKILANLTVKSIIIKIKINKYKKKSRK